MLKYCFAVLAGMGFAVAASVPVAAQTTTAAAMPETMAMLSRAIATETVENKGQVQVLAQYLAGKLEGAGFSKADIDIIPVEKTVAMVVRYRGSNPNAKPILISAHMDVVAANPADWKRDPFKLMKENGYLYGRGVADMKTGVVTLVETFMRFKRDGYVPNRDLIFVFSGDEETDMASTRALAKRYHNAEFLLNADAGGGTLDANGKPVIYQVQAAEKTFVDYLLTVTSPGGHSSAPSPKQNAIYRLARALDKIATYAFPVRYNDITKASLKALGAHGSGLLAAAMTEFAAHPGPGEAAEVIAADPAYVGQIRTTCVATLLNAGHARNALPQRATANINCRVFPGVPTADVKATLVKIIGDPTVQIMTEPPPPVESAASPLRKDVMTAVAATIHERFPGLDVVPAMSSGATDSMFFRNLGVPSYGVNPTFAKPDDTFAHGLNERLPATEVAASLNFWHSLLRKLTTD